MKISAVDLKYLLADPGVDVEVDVLEASRGHGHARGLRHLLVGSSVRANGVRARPEGDPVAALRIRGRGRGDRA